MQQILEILERLNNLVSLLDLIVVISVGSELAAWCLPAPLSPLQELF